MSTPQIPMVDLLAWTGGRALGPLPDFCTGVTQDTRNLRPGDLYVALRGERMDGHAFAVQAIEKGAAAALVAEDWDSVGTFKHLPLVAVADPMAALTRLAAAWRQRSRARIVGLTGSSGKTTTKELTAALLKAGGARVRYTQGNLNNAIGLPLSLLRLSDDDAFGVFETGTNHPGEIAHLAEILKPDAAILTNIGIAHIENFGSREAIAEEKGTLLAMAPENGFAVLPLETYGFDSIAARVKAKVVTVSLQSRDADYFGEAVNLSEGRVRITARDGSEVTLASGIPGEHIALDLLLAFAAAHQCGIAPEACVGALEGFSLPGGRWSVSRSGGVTYINDAYNANPQSMAASLTAFAGYPCDGRRIAVLGDMLELGNQSAALHGEIGAMCASLGVDLLITVGEQSAEHMVAAAIAAGLPPAQIRSFPDSGSATKAYLMETVASGDAVLFKGSHGMALEKLLP